MKTDPKLIPQLKTALKKLKSVEGRLRGALIQTFLGNSEMHAVQNTDSVFEKSICTQTTSFPLHLFNNSLGILKSVQGHFPLHRNNNSLDQFILVREKSSRSFPCINFNILWTSSFWCDKQKNQAFLRESSCHTFLSSLSPSFYFSDFHRLFTDLQNYFRQNQKKYNR